jgi:galactonate dehydratase
MIDRFAHCDAFGVRATDQTVWTFLRVEDVDGLVGWGESTLNGVEAGVCEASRQIAARLLNSPADLGHDLMAQVGATAGDMASVAVTCAFDQALWDIKGQRDGHPIHALLGPALRTLIPIYANINRRTRDRSPQGFAASARQAVTNGFNAIKIAPFDGVRPGEAMLIAGGIERAAAVRDAVGPDVQLLVDCHWRFDEPNAIFALDALSELDLYWFECPIAEEASQYPALRRLRDHSNRRGVKLAGCEMEVGLNGFRPFIDLGLYDVLMPDVKYAGGLKEFYRIAEYAAERDIAIAPHNPSGPVSHVASLHVSAGAPGFLMLEHQYEESAVFQEIVVGPLPPMTAGASTPPSAAGLGIDLNPHKLVPLAEFLSTEERAVH